MNEINKRSSTTEANIQTHNLSTKQERKIKRENYILEQDEYFEKGFSFAYKSEGECSKRTKHAKELLDRAGQSCKTHHIKGIKTTITISEGDNEKFLSYLKTKMDENGKTKAVFSGKDDPKQDKHVREQSDNAHVFPIKDNAEIRVVNNDEGGVCCLNKSSGQIVFVLLPRNEVEKLCSGSDVMKYQLALDRISECKPPVSGIRGNNRQLIFEGEARSNYINIGVAADRGGKGLIYKIPKNVEGTESQVWVRKWMSKVSNVVEKKYVPTKILSAFHKAGREVGFNGFEVDGVPMKNKAKNATEKGKKVRGHKTKKSRPRVCLFPTLALSKSVALTMHNDEDVFFSVAAVYAEDDWNNCTKRLKKNCEVLKYFTFGCGISVAMRTGDMLLFNPQEQHCISTNTEACGEKGVFTTSHYCKANLFGLNDNDIIFDE